MAKNKERLVALIILDGWGIAPSSDGNGITLAKTPVIDELITSYPSTTLQASGEAVGLYWGEMGNSEVGHTNLGVGRIFYQNLPRISKSIKDESFFKNQAFLKAIDHVKKNKSKLHLMGLVSSGKVHSLDEHLYALLELAKKEKVDDVYVHAFLDGRDTTYNSGIDFIKDLKEKIKKLKVGKIATLSGRFYAMDRDNHWERTEKTYKAMVFGQSEKKYKDSIKAIEDSYNEKVYDEEFRPTVITDKKDQPIAKVEDKDAIIFFNFRADRARQITKILTLPEFEKFENRPYFANLSFVSMTEYEKDLPVQVAFPPQKVPTCLAEIVSNKGMSQLHISETEKYAHITFFFNGGKEDPYKNEERIVVPSPRVASYDQKPEMSAKEVTSKLIKQINSEKHDFIVVNFANPDMVGHTGKVSATVRGVSFVDKYLGEIINSILSVNGLAVITADHGNAEELINLQTGEIDKEHSTNPVPFIVVGKEWQGRRISETGDTLGADLSLIPPTGILSDVTTTVLKLLELEKPEEITGTPLI